MSSAMAAGAAAALGPAVATEPAAHPRGVDVEGPYKSDHYRY